MSCRAAEPRRSGVSGEAARSAPAMQSASGAFPRALAGMACGRARAAVWDSNAVLTHHAKILPRKQGLATPGIGVLRCLLSPPKSGLAPGSAALVSAIWNPPFAGPDARQHVRGPRTALSRNPVASHLVPHPGFPKDFFALRPPGRRQNTAVRKTRPAGVRGADCGNALIHGGRGLPHPQSTEPR